MDIRLGDNQYGKAETRLVRVDRGEAGHAITDLNVTTTLSGDLAATHLTGDNSGVLPTDTQKNTVYAFARDGVGEIEDFAARLAKHFVDTTPTIRRVRGRRPGRHEHHRLGVPRVPQGRVHDAPGDERPHPRDRRLRAVAPRARGERRLARVARGGHQPPPRGVRRHAFPVTAANPLRHGRAGATAPGGAGRGSAVAAQQAPLPRRPVAVRAGQPRRGLLRRRPAVRAHRGHGRPGRRTGPGSGVVVIEWTSSDRPLWTKRWR